MSRFNTLINAFLGGEITPKAWSRIDSPVYPQSCKNILNMLNYPQGGAGRRPGTQYVTDTYSAKTAIRQIPYDPTGNASDAWMTLWTTDAVTAVKVTGLLLPTLPITQHSTQPQQQMLLQALLQRNFRSFSTPKWVYYYL